MGAEPVDGGAPRVAELWRYPVKSMRGERIEVAELDSDGIRGDRLLRVERDGRLVTARTRTDMLGVDPARAAEDLERVAPGSSLVSTSDGKRFDEMPILLLGVATAAAADLDSRRFRPSIVVDGLEAGEEDAWVGRRVRVGSATLLVDHRCERCVIITIDPDELEVDPSILQRIHRDYESRFGVLCEVAEPGEMRVGDPVEPL